MDSVEIAQNRRRTNVQSMRDKRSDPQIMTKRLELYIFQKVLFSGISLPSAKGVLPTLRVESVSTKERDHAMARRDLLPGR